MAGQDASPHLRSETNPDGDFDAAPGPAVDGHADLLRERVNRKLGQ
jgi:hypothetical protein